MSALGRVIPPDWAHLDRYPLAALAPEARPSHVPVAIGINWYTSADTPVQDSAGIWWACLNAKQLGTIRGGHCVCLEPAPDPTQPGREQDATAYYRFYNQGQEGSCEGHGHSRMQSLVLRKRFDAVWLYRQAQKIDGIHGVHEGTTNRAVLEVLRTQGHRVAHGTVSTKLTSSNKASLAYGITAYRWASTAEQVAATLGLPAGQNYVTVLNSWGAGYPERVRLPLATLARLLDEHGEAGVVTER